MTSWKLSQITGLISIEDVLEIVYAELNVQVTISSGQYKSAATQFPKLHFSRMAWPWVTPDNKYECTIDQELAGAAA